MIEHDNIFYIRDYSEIGGVETFVWELVKKYHDKDIAVVYKTAHKNQLKRIKKYCKAYKHTNQKIKCKVAIINYDVSIIDFINKDAEIYQVVHGDYENPVYKWKPPTHERIKEYIGVTKYVRDSFKRITGLKNVTYGYNPLTVETEKKLILLSATRLSAIKGKNRMIKLANELDLRGINYIWYVFTNDVEEIKSPNVVYMKPRLDVGYWLQQADYVVQLSDTEACSYTINEALYRNIPVIVTPLPYLQEIGVEDGKNAYIMEFDCSNVGEIANKILNIPKFKFKQLEDNYGEILADGKSHYKEDLEVKVRVEAIRSYFDMEDNEQKYATLPSWAKETQHIWVTSKERADELLKVTPSIIKVLEEIKPTKIEETKTMEVKETIPKEKIEKAKKKLKK